MFNFTRHLFTAIAFTIISSALPAIILVAAIAAPVVASQKITSAQVRQTLESMLAATKRQDVTGIMQFIAPDATISVSMQSSLGAQQMELNRDEYRDYLDQAFRSMKSYSSKYSNLKINISPNGKTAAARLKLEEVAVLRVYNSTVRSVSDEVLKFAIVDGKLLITSVEAKSTVDVK